MPVTQRPGSSTRVMSTCSPIAVRKTSRYRSIHWPFTSQHGEAVPPCVAKNFPLCWSD